ncbi:MAG: hypothetical protein H6745_05345 [Deltaproteobacteria bacterium]|nr:hypothetical protein [Deltaproteobacteria bacterium]
MIACRACRSRVCCTREHTPVTHRDVARVAAALAVAPELFCDAVPTSAEDPLGLDLGDGRRARAVLRRRDDGDGALACLFLLALDGGRRLCGLGELAPRRCGLFPVIGRGEVAADGLCWRPWRWEELAGDVDREALTALEADRAAFAAVVARWNAFAARRRRRLSLATALAFLLNEAAREAEAAP